MVVLGGKRASAAHGMRLMGELRKGNVIGNPAALLVNGRAARLILNERNKAPHTETVLCQMWRHERRRWGYSLEERGKELKKRYFDDDLERVRLPDRRH